MHDNEPDDTPQVSRRVESIDALRGFDMFWILGGDHLMASLRSVSLVIDVWRIRSWSRPFVWIGMNCITVYVVNNLVGGFGGLVRRVLHKPFLEATAPWGDLIVSVLGLALAIAFCHFLYRRRIFIRV